TEKLENLCSGWSWEGRLRRAMRFDADTPLARLCEGDPERITAALVGEAARQGDAGAEKAIEQVASSIGVAIANVVSLFHPERIALGGGVSLLGETLLEPIRRHVDRRAFGPFRGRYDIVPCELGESVVLVGALLLAGGSAQ
ncbi:MAG TPA: ROK family protein, partial [Candidatus Hydrogenedentes bacterium]|nr:ROK family protein [Candidatus Hydrogenedentota bacterium]